MSYKTKFIIVGNGVIPVVEINDEYLAPENTIFKKSNYIIYNDKMDAFYYKLIKELENGKSLSNYKTSKHYKYYIKRLKKENPEFII